MRLLAAFLLLAGVGACADDDPGETPPVDRFHFPVSLVRAETTAGAPGGTLYVVSSNFDLFYNRGSVLAVDLDRLNQREPTPSIPVSELVDPGSGHAFIDSFAGRAALHAPSTGNRSLIVPTRFRGRMYALEVAGARVWCRGDETKRDCIDEGVELRDGTRNGNDPFAALVVGDTVFVNHLRDDEGSSYLFRMPVADLTQRSSTPIGTSPSDALAFGTVTGTPATATSIPTLFLTGRALFNLPSQALRTLPVSLAGEPQADAAVDAGVTTRTRIRETRGIGVSNDGRRLYLTTRGVADAANPEGQGPDGLLVVDVRAQADGSLQHQEVRFVPMPRGTSDVLVIPRAGRRELVAVACTEENSVAIYDDDLGEVAALVRDIREPFGMTWAPKPAAGTAQLFVASFGGHSVDVIDLNLALPRSAVRVSRIGGEEGR